MTDDLRRLNKVRKRYAEAVAADHRVRAAFAAVPREDFLPPGPWLMSGGDGFARTPDADPARLYTDDLVALDYEKGINTGQPSMHAAWLAAVAPRPGETVTQVGAGMGYYTAILARLVAPGGHVEAFEVEPHLAEAARRNLAGYAGVSVLAADATDHALAPSDVIYVNAGVVAPPAAWLRALKPGGRMIFPWRPEHWIGLTVLITRRDDRFVARTLGHSWFIPCVGASSLDLCLKAPDSMGASAIASVWLTQDRPPDATAVAVYRDVWFSDAG